MYRAIPPISSSDIHACHTTILSIKRSAQTEEKACDYSLHTLNTPPTPTRAPKPLNSILIYIYTYAERGPYMEKLTSKRLRTVDNATNVTNAIERYTHNATPNARRIVPETTIRHKVCRPFTYILVLQYRSCYILLLIRAVYIIVNPTGFY